MRTWCVFVFLVLGATTAQASRLEDKAFEIGPGVTPPDSSGAVVLQTPSGVAAADAHATVRVRLLIDKAGYVRRAEALDPPDPGLAEAAETFFKKAHFPPARQGAKPVAVWWSSKVSFRPKAELDAQVPPADCVATANEEVIGQGEALDDVELPRLIEAVEPSYPSSLRNDRVSGQARFVCIIDSCGRVRDCSILNASHGEFGRAGLAAIVRRRYAPARRGGKPVAIWFTIGTTFNVR